MAHFFFLFFLTNPKRLLKLDSLPFRSPSFFFFFVFFFYVLFFFVLFVFVFFVFVFFSLGCQRLWFFFLLFFLLLLCMWTFTDTEVFSSSSSFSFLFFLFRKSLEGQSTSFVGIRLPPLLLPSSTAPPPPHTHTHSHLLPSPTPSHPPPTRSVHTHTSAVIRPRLTASCICCVRTYVTCLCLYILQADKNMIDRFIEWTSCVCRLAGSLFRWCGRG